MPKRSTTNALKEKDCTGECQSIQHANELISAITLPLTAILDKQLASYFESKCSNFAKLRDGCGRSLLHVAASCGRRDLTIWLLKVCDENINFAEIESGYTALHRSIAYGFINVAVALIQINANLDVKDNEDLCPLDLLLKPLNLSSVEHILYSRFPPNYNPCDFALLKPNDIETIFARKPLKKCKTDFDKFVSFHEDKLKTLNHVSNAFVTEVYTWGTNLNYTSGFASATGKSRPEFLEFFEKKNEIIIEISMQQFHTLFVSLAGNVWSCGIGHGGRLGLSSGVVIIPQQVSLASPSTPNVFCISVATGQEHSVFLCNGNRVFVCGTNTYHQLGISPPPGAVIKPVEVNIDHGGQQILGVAASDFHSVVWTGCAVFTCGLQAGQLGHTYSGNTIPTFKRVPGTFPPILTVAVSRAATVIATDSYIYVLNSYKCVKIELRSILIAIYDKEIERDHRYNKNDSIDEQVSLKHVVYRRILKLVAFGGELDAEQSKLFSISPSAQELQIAVVLRNGGLYLWRKSDERLLRCYFLARYDISVTNVIINSRGMWISTERGEVLGIRKLEIADFSLELNDGFIPYSRRSVSESSNDCYIVEVEKVEGVFRAVSIFSNPKGDNFAMLQHRSADSLMPMPTTTSYTLKTDLTQFFLETEVNDSFHDIIFQVGKKFFAAHKYILASCSEQFLKLEESDGVVVINDIGPEVFETILEFVYTGFCSIRKYSFPHSNYQVLFRRIYDAAETFRIKKLENYLETLRTLENFTVDPDSDFIIHREIISPLRFNRLKFSSLYDIKLKSQDGAIFHAHKCILVARVEYFKSMLSGNWIESSNPHQSYYVPFPGSVVNEILEFLYTDKISANTRERETHFWCNLIMAADQFILPNLKELAERALSQCLNVRNVVEFLMLTDLVHTHGLKRACFEFICINLPSILFSKDLSTIDDKLLDQLTVYYRDEFLSTRSQRFPDLPVYSTVCDISDIFAAEVSHPVDWDVITDKNQEKDEPISRVGKTKPKTKVKKLRKSVTHDVDISIDQKPSKILPGKQIVTPTTEESAIVENKLPNPEWVAVDRQMRRVQTRLRVNAAVKECPQLIEQKENFMPFNDARSSSDAKPLTESNRNETTLRDSNYSIDISKLSPKISQAERKRLRKVSESSKGRNGPSSPENHEKSDEGNDSPGPSSPPRGWKVLQEAVDHSASFSSIMASEQKQKTSAIKETKKIVTKSLHSTQIEEQAIQELLVFYNAKNVDDEHITVQRVPRETYAPQWVTK